MNKTVKHYSELVLAKTEKKYLQNYNTFLKGCNKRYNRSLRQDWKQRKSRQY